MTYYNLGKTTIPTSSGDLPWGIDWCFPWNSVVVSLNMMILVWNAGWKPQKWRIWRRSRTGTEELGIWMRENFFMCLVFSLPKFFFTKVTTWCYQQLQDFSCPVPNSITLFAPKLCSSHVWSLMANFAGECRNIITVLCPSELFRVKEHQELTF